jgi:hypothetical protein
MIAELGLAAPAMVGTALGLLKSWMANRSENSRLKEHRKILRDKENAAQILAHLNVVVDKPFFTWTVLMLTSTVCLSIILCIDNPERILITLPPDPKPVKWQFWLFSYEYQRLDTVIVTTGGVGYNLLQAVVFQIGYVLTGGRR